MRASANEIFFPFIVLASLLGPVLSAQSIPPHATTFKTFHVKGTIDSPWDSLAINQEILPRGKVTFPGRQDLKVVRTVNNIPYVFVPRTEVTFTGERAIKTVVADENGFYKTDLPLGLYTMTAVGPTINAQTLTKFVRVFLVKFPTTVTLDGRLLANWDCDAMISGTPDEQADRWIDACGGSETFPMPAADGTAFRLFIRFSGRAGKLSGWTYSSGDVHSPVLVTYNLFSMEADEAVYDPTSSTIRAIGKLTVSNEGETTRIQSAAFSLKDGKATLIK